MCLLPGQTMWCWAARIVEATRMSRRLLAYLYRESARKFADELLGEVTEFGSSDLIEDALNKRINKATSYETKNQRKPVKLPVPSALQAPFQQIAMIPVSTVKGVQQQRYGTPCSGARCESSGHMPLKCTIGLKHAPHIYILYLSIYLSIYLSGWMDGWIDC